MLNYLTYACPVVNLQSYCQNGSMASVSLYVFVFKMYVLGYFDKTFLFCHYCDKDAVGYNLLINTQSEYIDD